MTQDVLARGTGGAHLHDPDGTVVGAPPADAEVYQLKTFSETASHPSPECSDMGTGLEPISAPPVPAASTVRPAVDWATAPVLTETLRAARLTAGLPPDPTVLAPDPDATVTIGRHRADGTLSGPDDWWDEPAPPRRRFLGRVAAAVVAAFRGEGR